MCKDKSKYSFMFQIFEYILAKSTLRQGQDNMTMIIIKNDLKYKNIAKTKTGKVEAEKMEAEMIEADILEMEKTEMNKTETEKKTEAKKTVTKKIQTKTDIKKIKRFKK